MNAYMTEHEVVQLLDIPGIPEQNRRLNQTLFNFDYSLIYHKKVSRLFLALESKVVVIVSESGQD